MYIEDVAGDTIAFTTIYMCEVNWGVECKPNPLQHMYGLQVVLLMQQRTTLFSGISGLLGLDGTPIAVNFCY
jgi:hypothetical protein